MQESLKRKNPHIRQGLQIKFNEVPASGLDYEFTQTTGELNGVLFDILGDFPTYQAQVHLAPTNQNVQVKGQIQGELHLSCSRCAEDFRSSFNKSFVTLFYKSENDIKNLGLDAHDLVGSFDLEFLEGDTINVGEIIHEQIALEIPFTPICMDSCKGLCGQCGHNLNQSPCMTHQQSNDNNTWQKPSPFEKLKILRGE